MMLVALIIELRAVEEAVVVDSNVLVAVDNTVVD